MPLPDDTLYQYILTGSYLGQTIINTLWFTTKETSPKNNAQEEADAIIGEIGSWFVDNYLLWANINYQPLQAVVNVMAGAPPYQSILNYTNRFGSISSDGLPPHDAALISTYTGFHGKSLHGRIYLAGVSEIDQTGGALTAPSLAKLKAVADGLVTRFGFNGTSSYVRLGVFSRKAGRTLFPGPPAHYEYNPLACVHVKSAVVKDTIRTQRHRRRA